MKTKNPKGRSKSAGKARTKQKQPVLTPAPKTHLELFGRFVGIIKDGPPDLARNHKLYASGIKKWK